MYPKDDQFSLIVQNVFSWTAAVNEKNPPRNLFKEMLVQNVFSSAAAANERKPPSKSLQRNARTVEFKEQKRRGFLLTFHSTSLLFFASLCCSVRDGRCCTLQRSSTSLLLLHNLNIPPSFKDLGLHTISVPTYSHCQPVYSVFVHLALYFSSLDFSSASCHLKEEWSVQC